MNFTLQRKADLDTPCLVLDLEILDKNLRKMQTLTKRAGKRLRPHAKTHKCSILAQHQMETGAIGICAAAVNNPLATGLRLPRRSSFGYEGWTGKEG